MTSPDRVNNPLSGITPTAPDNFSISTETSNQQAIELAFQNRAPIPTGEHPHNAEESSTLSRFGFDGSSRRSNVADDDMSVRHHDSDSVHSNWSSERRNFDPQLSWPNENRAILDNIDNLEETAGETSNWGNYSPPRDNKNRDNAWDVRSTHSSVLGWNVSDTIPLVLPSSLSIEEDEHESGQGNALWRAAKSTFALMQSMSNCITPRPPSIASSNVSIQTHDSIGPKCENWTELFEILAQTHPSEPPSFDHYTVNGTFNQIPSGRPLLFASAYKEAVTNVAQQASSLAHGSSSDEDELSEKLRSLDQGLDNALATHPNIPSNRHGEFAQMHSKIYIGLNTFLEDIPNRVLFRDFVRTLSRRIELSHEKLRALVLDIAITTNLSGKPLIGFVEHSFNKDAEAIYRCATEFDMQRQTMIFNGSKVLNAALKIPPSFSSRALGVLSSCGAWGKFNGPLKPDVLPSALARAAIFAQDSKKKELCFDLLERSLRVPEIDAPDIVKSEVCRILCAALPQLDSSAIERAREIIVPALTSLHDRFTGRPLCELLSVHPRLPADRLHWVNQLIDHELTAMGFAAAEMKSDVAATKAINWLCDQIKNDGITNAIVVDQLYFKLCAASLEKMTGPRQMVLLTRLLELSDSVSCKPRLQLIIYATIRMVGNDFADHVGQPDLFDRILEKELEHFPKMISEGHSFDKHVLGIENPDLEGNIVGPEFTHVFQCTGDRQTDIARFEQHIRLAMQEATTVRLNDGIQYFQHVPTRTTVVCNPWDRDGGTAFVYSTSEEQQQQISR